MKNQTLNVLAAFLLVAGLAFAQRAGMGKGMAQGAGTGQIMGAGMGNGQMQPLTPAEMIAKRVERLTTVLDLTAAQAAEITKSFTREQADVAAVTATLATVRDQLQTAIKANDLNKINSTAAAIGTAHGQVVAIQAKAQAAFRMVLTPDQVAKLDAMRGGVGRP